MSPLAALAIFAAGLAAGTVNVIVGSGSLITFPTLLALGYPPVLANVSNTVGLVPGSVSATVAYRRELVGQRRRVIQLGSASVLGGLTGAALLLGLPHSVFKAAIPALVALAALLMAAQPRMKAGLERRGPRRAHGGVALMVGVFITGIYGGYFGAAQGILMLAVLGLTIDDELQRLNAVKVITTGFTNLIAGLIFVFAAHVAWAPAGLIAAGSVLGGVLGSRYGRRLPPAALRGLIVVVGIVAIVRLV